MRRRGLTVPPPAPDDPGELFRGAVGSDPDPWQAGVLASEARRLLLNCCRQSGKSTVTAVLALREAVNRPGSLVLLLSPSLRQSGELFRKVMRGYRALGRPVAATSETALTLELANGSRVVSLPAVEGTVRGYSGVRLLIVDEAAWTPDELYYAVRPMLAVGGGRLVLLSTPAGRKGFFWKEWSAPDSAGWQKVRVTAEQCPRIPAAFLEEERRSHPDSWYRQEYLAEFHDGTDSPLFPGAWLAHARDLAEKLRGHRRHALAVGVDPGEGSAHTSLCAVDDLGVVELVSVRTPDTAVVPGLVREFAGRHGVEAQAVALDRGGGGKQHADRLRDQGFDVRTVAFGEAVTPALFEGDARSGRERRYAYKNRRAQMYGELRELLDPSSPRGGFAIPAECGELFGQLSPIPYLADGEGRLYLPPKNARSPQDRGVTLASLIGRSPDDADALVLAVHAMLHPEESVVVGLL